MIGVERKFTSVFNSDGTDANWDDVLVFDISSFDDKTLRIVLCVQIEGLDIVIGEGNVDLNKHYKKESHRQVERINLSNVDKSIGELILTV